MTDMLPVAILAGGLATRLRPFTTHVPKSMIPIAGKPFIAHQLHMLAQQGVTDVVVCTGHLGDVIQDYLDKFDSELNIRISQDNPPRCGTAGALRTALPLLGQEFFVMYGDCYLHCNLADIQVAFNTSQSLSLMTIYKPLDYDDKWSKLNVELNEYGQLVTYDKWHINTRMTHSDYGLSIINRSILDNGFDDIADIFNSIPKNIVMFEVPGIPYEIGSYEGIKTTEMYFRSLL